jgi:hypothetical protein
LGNKGLRLVLDNVNTLLFVIGFVALCVGVAGWSAPAAKVTAGIVCMAIAAIPYLRKR